MFMRKKIISLALLSMLSLASEVYAMPAPQSDNPKADIEELIVRNRWSDARFLLTEYREKLNAVKDRYELEWVDYQLVLCQVELGSTDAVKYMLDFMKRYPQSQHANRMLYELGCYYAKNNDFARAEEYFSQVDYEGLSSREREKYDVRMGYIRFIQDDYLSAKTRFSQIPGKSDFYPHALYYVSYIDYVSGRNDYAHIGFTKLQNDDSDNNPYRDFMPFYLLQLDYREQKYDSVIKIGEELLKVETSAEVHNDLVRIVAESYFIKGEYEQALKHIITYPTSKYTRQEHYIKGYSLYRLGRYNDAIQPLHAVCGAMDGLTQNASYHLAECYLESGDKQSAASAFSMASTDGYDATLAQNALLNYGRLKYELDGDLFNESINVLKKYLDKYPESEYCAEVQTLLIAAYYKSKDYVATYNAIKAFENPGKDLRIALQKVTVIRALDAVKSGNYNLAKELFEEAQSGINAKYNALSIYWQGEIAIIQGYYGDAKRKFEEYVSKAAKTADEYLMAYYGIGYANFQMKDMKAAATAFDRFVREYKTEDSYLFDAYNRLGDTRFAQRQFSQARKAYNVALKSEGAERNYARYQLAIIDGVESKHDSKIERLRGIIADTEGNFVDDAWYELGRTYIALERFADGATALEEFVAKDQTSPYYINALGDLGLAYINLDDKESARKYYEQVVAFDPQSSAAMEAMRGIREIYVATGDIDAYFKYAERSGVQTDVSVVVRDSLTFASARTIYLDGDIPRAQSKLRGYLNDFESGFNRTEALFYLSDCYLRTEQRDSALMSMEEIVEHGNSKYVERVLTTMAPMCMSMEKYEKSANAYRKLYDVAHDVEKRRRASDGYVDATLKYADDDRLLAMVEDVDSMADATGSAKRRATLAKARVLHRRGDASAYEIFGLLSDMRSTPEGAEAYYRLVEQQYNLGNYDAAEQMVYYCGEFGSLYWQAKCFLLLGDIMLKQDNAFQARATYQSIVDGYSIEDDGIIDEAIARINSMK